jgi:hypothetical protein
VAEHRGLERPTREECLLSRDTCAAELRPGPEQGRGAPHPGPSVSRAVVVVRLRGQPFHEPAPPLSAGGAIELSRALDRIAGGLEPRRMRRTVA